MEHSFLLACFIFLSAAVIVVPFAKATGLGSVLGYLLAGIFIGPYGLKLVTDPETILHFSEFGVVMMLFLIGLELQVRELWSMRNKLFGLGLPQVLLTALVLGLIGYLANMPWQSAIIMGLGLALSSTAIVLKIIEERGIMATNTGRSAFSVLLLQDIAVIPILAIIPLLALPELAGHTPVDDGHGPGEVAPEGGWQVAAKTAFVFASMYLSGRYLLRPVLRFIAKSGVREIFTALSLLLVVASALLMEWINVSAALGAFMVGVILADSEYRHELESDIEPFKGLLLGLFFISVGMSIEFEVLMNNPLLIASMVAGLAIIKMAILWGLGMVFRFHIADRMLFAIILAQGGEFGFVLFQFATASGALLPEHADLLNVTVAISMVITPILILIYDRLLSPKMVRDAQTEREPDDISVRNRVIVLGYGRFGQIVTRLITAQGFEATLIDHDAEQIELVKRFDTKVFFGDARRADLLAAAGAHEAQILIIAIHNPNTVTEIAAMVKKHFPHITILARARDRNHAHELMDVGVKHFVRDTFHSGLQLGIKALVALGYEEHRAYRLAKTFARHDIKMLHEAYEIKDDMEAIIGHARTAKELLAQVMESDLVDLDPANATNWTSDKNPDDIERENKARSQE
ncbi:monovalent cation:proton antiporter-2 (CPA2) family protein [Maritalea mediterranea]|uniref:Monovalent cation:proton antiporter-2 (CPA2) family protein n=1 Tax=Maritalea mediterranea TaxID=2909667 RepID=A0ABS9E9T1_9HYPH|nr:monovalent cation:proton antiporter-2 (CPA2) family protein [Maritalea mediterranea]MCF4099641.1 monovalent cation:proton antiporter-2 (CPA2) family protein [Maritalea mediterranea]